MRGSLRQTYTQMPSIIEPLQSGERGNKMPSPNAIPLLALLPPAGGESFGAGALPDVCREPGIPSFWRLPALTPCSNPRRIPYWLQDSRDYLRNDDARVKNPKSLNLSRRYLNDPLNLRSLFNTAQYICRLGRPGGVADPAASCGVAAG